MIRRTVVIRQAAKNDLRDLRRWIAERESPRTADKYLRRLRAYLTRLGDLAEVGERLGRLAPGVRAINFEGRRRVLFVVQARRVKILRVVYSGRDLDRVVAETDFARTP